MRKRQHAECMLAINLNSTERRKAHGVRSGLEPDSGNPTVRDHREALGNTAREELGTRPTNRKSGYGNSLPKVLVRSVSIPLTLPSSKTVKTVLSLIKGSLITGLKPRC